jgi:hypothetical protein
MLGINIPHQTLMSVLRDDAVFRALIEDEEKRYVEMWPASALYPHVMRYGWLHSVIQRRGRKLLLQNRWPQGWPSVDELAKLFAKACPREDLLTLTSRGNLIAVSGMPRELREKVHARLSQILGTKPTNTGIVRIRRWTNKLVEKYTVTTLKHRETLAKAMMEAGVPEKLRIAVTRKVQKELSRIS